MAPNRKSRLMAMRHTGEHPENKLAVPPLVDTIIVTRFCRAVQRCADDQGLGNEARKALAQLRAKLTTLTNLAALCRLAIVGQLHAFARVIDELQCLEAEHSAEAPDADHSAHTPDRDSHDHPFRADEQIQLTAPFDLLAGAAFVCKDQRTRRDGFIHGIVHAIEDAVAFPIAFSVEAARYLGEGGGEISPFQASAVIANATQRLLEGDPACTPRLPGRVCDRLRWLARAWISENPVTKYLEVISGPRVLAVEVAEQDHSSAVAIGDLVTVRFHLPAGNRHLSDVAVVFCPHQPAEVMRAVEGGVQVRVPEGAITGPVAIVHRKPDFEAVWNVIFSYGNEYPAAMAASVFGLVRMDTWAYPFSFQHPVVAIATGEAG